MTTVTRPGPSTTDWGVAVGTGMVRIAAGVGLLRSRRSLIRLAGGDPDDALLGALFTYFGVRDVAVGVATLATTRPGAQPRNAVLLQGAADTTDAALIVAVIRSGRLPVVRGAGMVALAAVTALIEYAGALRLRRSA